MKEAIVVIGGAGYIGSHTAYLLADLGIQTIIIDNLSQKQTFNYPWAHFVQADFGDRAMLRALFSSYNVQAVMHFAGYIEVGESVKKPLQFYSNNVTKTLVLLEEMLAHNIKKLIFSSTCAVYGEPEHMPMTERHSRSPVSPYGKTKLAVEFMLEDFAQAYDLSFIGLRYFNAAGSWWKHGLGEKHNPETHIIPLLLRAIANGTKFKIFGTDYDTADGTCIRDYVHVADIARAHVQGLKYLNDGGASDFINLGTGKGYSVLQVVREAENVMGKKVDLEFCQRRNGDAPILIADASKAQALLEWEPNASSLNNIVQSAHCWEQQLSNLKMPIETKPSSMSGAL